MGSNLNPTFIPPTSALPECQHKAVVKPDPFNRDDGDDMIAREQVKSRSRNEKAVDEWKTRAVDDINYGSIDKSYKKQHSMSTNLKPPFLGKLIVPSKPEPPSEQHNEQTQPPINTISGSKPWMLPMGKTFQF